MSIAPHRAEWEGRGPAHSGARILYELSPVGDGDGPTMFEYTNEFSAPGGRLGYCRQQVHRGRRLGARSKQFTVSIEVAA